MLSTSCVSIFNLHSIRKSCVLQEAWCKKGPPSQQLLATYRPQPALPRKPPPRPPPPSPALVVELIRAADALGRLLQYNHQGFLANVRQQRMGGLAAIELAQTVRHLVGTFPASLLEVLAGIISSILCL